LNDPYTVFDNIKNTPKYWQKYRYEMIAKLENLGPFQWFFTLSCADMKWDENFSSLLRDRNVQIEYEVSGTDGLSKTIIKFMKNEIEEELELQEYLKSEIDENLHELIRTNVLNATRNFQHRVDAFIKEIIFGDNNPMQIKNLSYKVEFQGRGAGHIHGVLWANLSRFEKEANDEKPEFQHLTAAFTKLRENESLEPKEIEELEKYVDMFITCSLNPDRLSKMGGTNGFNLAKLAEEVQQHKHTKTCHKYDKTCRFHKPTFPMKKKNFVPK
jgi:superfamily II DNA helicase RecQ